MGRILVALYKDTQTARSVVDALLEAGFSADDINLLVNGSGSTGDTGEVGITECAGLGALVGALVGIGSSLVPGIGPALGMGIVGVAVTAGIGAAVGALTGGITAGLIDLSPTNSGLQLYGELFSGSGTIVCLKTQEDWLEWAERIMLRYQPLKLEGRAAQGYSSPWLTLAAEKYESGKLPTLADISSTRLRQLDSTIKLSKGVQVYEYRN